MTPSENILWQALRRSQLGGFHFRRQRTIDGFVVDFYCHAIGLVIELDGEIHQQQKNTMLNGIASSNNAASPCYGCRIAPLPPLSLPPLNSSVPSATS